MVIVKKEVQTDMNGQADRVTDIHTDRESDRHTNRDRLTERWKEGKADRQWVRGRAGFSRSSNNQQNRCLLGPGALATGKNIYIFLVASTRKVIIAGYFSPST